MYESFENLPEAKRNKILLACMEEFANNGFERASTNNIVKQAGISKGLLFHYFGNKKNLFLYLIDHAMDYFIEKFYSFNEPLPEDIFEKIAARGKMKLRMAYEDPLKYRLVFQAFIGTPEELKTELAKRYKKLADTHIPLVFQGIDTTRFRNDVDQKRALELVIMVMEAITNKYTELYKHSKPEEALDHMDKIFDEYYAFAEILKKGMYKPEA